MESPIHIPECSECVGRCVAVWCVGQHVTQHVVSVGVSLSVVQASGPAVRKEQPPWLPDRLVGHGLLGWSLRSSQAEAVNVPLFPLHTVVDR